ncbi:hypothetical protein [Flavihumibacter petaseus]|uniref:ParB-related ThiF-related cassette protein E domain-containing protein n=1 Tax=Flavihumibacter petaseus NBRC 106054 TaxID=1220578 RepID=A0A0E9N269_9BACT|nr:hypothetical protein [Flavihumibacter petaseus]GAO43761.1 hypothetical protein FPE01S_02_08670 [Flavihumibacter petaseus NBRC 106054]
MNFFQSLFEAAPGLDLTIRMKEKAGIITMTVLPHVGAKDGKIKPVNISGTPADLDEGFFAAITPMLEAAKGLTVSEGPETASDSGDDNGTGKSAPAKKQPVEKKSTAKKQAMKKAAKAEPKDSDTDSEGDQPPTEELKPKVETPSLF